jgi:2-methylcitrate dehydratase
LTVRCPAYAYLLLKDHSFQLQEAMAAPHEENLMYDQLLLEIVDYVYNYEPSPEVLNKARFTLLDTLGCVSQAIVHSEEALQIVNALTAGAFANPGFHLPGTDQSLDPVRGTFALGVLIRYLDCNDALTGAEWGHPSGQ